MINSQDVTLFLKQTLNRFKKDEFPQVVKEWGFVKTDNFGSSKKSAVNEILADCQKKEIKPKTVFELQLISTVLHPTNKKWTVYKLTRSSGSADLTNPYVIQRKIKKQISSFFKHCLCFRKHSDSLWFHVAILQDSPHSQACFLPSNSFLIVHYPHSPYIMVTNIKAAYKDIVMQALMNSLECTKIQELKLTGRNLHSLADMVLNCDSQGAFSQYRLNKIDQNPLTRKSRKRPRGPEVKEEVFDGRICCEDIQEKKQRKEINISTFGINKQPILETVKYNLETTFRGTDFAPAMDQKKPFRCRVKFEGTNVLEGIKQLGPAGLAILPLPHHIGRVHSLAKNHLLVSDKKTNHTV
ncbi:centromere protein N-like [Antedon mediterranea]|uniref:centromere protein N-like n=1 Tax=Antedon mediterranea TaxID=105859 RepID=UPI003AF5BDB1